MKQNYENYTTEDHKVWSILFSRQIENLKTKVSKTYLEGISKVGFKSNRIPDFIATEKQFESHTKWKLHVVPGIIPVEPFFELLSQKKFSATTWLRKMHQLDYIEEPDMFHDVFGHIPLLSNTAYSNFVEGMSHIALKHIQNHEVMEMLGRIYWFTLEFGLIKEEGQLKIYGAGIISSVGETEHSLSDKPERKPFDVKEIMMTPFQNDRIQEKYFVIDSYEQLFDSLQEIENVIAECLQTSNRSEVK
jgi:phenylalanine-4-hydroxylase